MTKHLSWLSLTLLAPTLYAYELSGHKWTSPETTMAYDIVNTRGETTAPNGQSWNSAFEEAAQRWNHRTGFTFHMQQDPKLRNVDICQDDGVNSIQFRRDDCGFDFGSTVLGITYSLFVKDRLLEADIAINDNEPWDIYSGEVRPDVSDFRRVAAHEMGHVIGLEHEDQTPSIMASFVEDIEYPIKDDIQGTSAVYGLPVQLPASCQTITAIPLNDVIAGTFEQNDCRKLDLTARETDQGPVDLYRFNLPTSGLVVILLNSDKVQTLLALFDNDRKQLLEYNAGETGSFIVRNLPAGSYQIAATTATNTADTGDYALQVIMNSGNATLPARFDETSKSILIDSANVNGTFYQATLEWYDNPDDPSGMYWRLASYGATTLKTPGVTLLPNFDLVFHPISALGKQYDGVLERYHSPAEPNGWFWRLKSATPRR